MMTRHDRKALKPKGVLITLRNTGTWYRLSLGI